MKTPCNNPWYCPLVIGLLVMFIGWGCEHEPDLTPVDGGGGNPGGGGGPVIPPPDPKACDPDTVYFQTQILPIFVSNCAIAGCHDRASAQKDVILTDYSSILMEVNPGDLDGSDIYDVLTEDSPDKLMPRNPDTMLGESLSQEQIDLIGTWILQGALNNTCDTCDSTDFTFSGKVKFIIESNCATSVSCHGAGSVNDYTTYAGLKAKVDNGTFELRVLRNLNMPPAAPLPECERIILSKWLENGAPND